MARHYFDGAVCSGCGWSLDNEGYCTNKRCGYSDYFQDEVGGWLLYHDKGKISDGVWDRMATLQPNDTVRITLILNRQQSTPEETDFTVIADVTVENVEEIARLGIVKAIT